MESDPTQGRVRSFRLRWELALALAIKVAFVITLKFAFFNHPVSKTEAANALAERIGGSISIPNQRPPHNPSTDLEKP